MGFKRWVLPFVFLILGVLFLIIGEYIHSQHLSWIDRPIDTLLLNIYEAINFLGFLFVLLFIIILLLVIFRLDEKYTGNWKKTILISAIIFAVISLILLIWFFMNPSGLTKGSFIFLVILSSLISGIVLVIPLLFSIVVGINCLEKGENKKIFLKSSLITFIVSFIEMGIVWMLVVLSCANSYNPAGGKCTGIIFLGIINLSASITFYITIILVITFISLFISLLLHKMYRNKDLKSYG